MNIDVYSSSGAKKGQQSLPDVLFAVPVNNGLVHQALILQQSNRRKAIAHAKNRHEVAGSTRKLYGQKHTGQARRGSIRSPLLRGGGKAFGPRSTQNFSKDMPREMRHAALAACLTLQARKNSIFGLEGYGDVIKTKAFVDFLGKLPVDIGRHILFVLPEKNDALYRSSRNVPNVKTILVNYLNPEDVLRSRSIIFVGDSVEKAVAIFGTKKDKSSKQKPEEKKEDTEEAKVTKATKGTKVKKPATKKAAPKKSASKKTA